jgi:hypothetical protein
MQNLAMGLLLLQKEQAHMPEFKLILKTLALNG